MSIQIGPTKVSGENIERTTTERLILYSDKDSNIIRLRSDTAQCLINCDQFSFGRSNVAFQLSDSSVPLLAAQSNIGIVTFCPFTTSNVCTFASNVNGNMNIAATTMTSTSVSITGVANNNRSLLSVNKSDNNNIITASPTGLITMNPFVGIGTTMLYSGTQLHVESNVYISNSLTTTNAFLNTINDRTNATVITMRQNNIELKATTILVKGDMTVEGKLPFNTRADFFGGATVYVDLTSVNMNIINNDRLIAPLFNMQYGGNIDSVTSNLMSVKIRPTDSNIAAFTMDNRGRVGFGSAVPSAIIDVLSTSNHNAPYNFRIKDQQRPWNNFAIDCNANVGIGTDTPMNKLYISFPDEVPPTLWLEGCNAVITVDSSNNSNVTSNAIWSYCNFASSAPIVNIANNEIYSFPNRPILVASCNATEVFRIGSQGQVNIGINVTSNIDERYGINVDPKWLSRIPSVEIFNLYGDQYASNSINGQLTNLYNMNTMNSSNSYIGNLNTSNIYTKYIYAESYEILSMRCIESDPSLFEVLVDNFHFPGKSIIFASNYEDRPTDPVTGGKLKIVCDDPPVGALSRGIVVTGNNDNAISVQSYQSAPYYELVTRNNSARMGMLIDGTIALSQSADFSQTATPKFRIFNTYSANPTGAIAVMSSGLFTNAGLNINQTSPSFTRALQVSGDCIFTDGANVPNPVVFVSATNGNPRRVGICTDAPLFNLDVQGTQNVSGMARFASTVGIGTAASATNALTINNTGTGACISVSTSTSNFIVDNRGNVGLGTTQPRFSIDINGDINFTGGVFKNSLPYIQSQFTTGSNGNIFIMQNLGIGTTTPQYGLDVFGRDVRFSCNVFVGSNITCEGTVYAKGSFITTSDRAVKVDLAPISGALDKVSRINGYTYFRTDLRKREAGLVAQEVQQVLPEVVSTGNPLMSISYGNVASLFVEAIKEMKNKIECLESEIRDLKSKLHTL